MIKKTKTNIKKGMLSFWREHQAIFQVNYIDVNWPNEI